MQQAGRLPLTSADTRFRHGGPDGYLLIESLTALAVLGIGLVPLATLAPVALGALRHYEAIGHATRAAAELAELDAPRLMLAPLHKRGIGLAHLHLCQSLGATGTGEGTPACARGTTLAVVGPLPSPAGSDAGRLKWLALWLRP